MGKTSFLLVVLVVLPLLVTIDYYAFSETDSIQISVSIPLEGSSEFCGKTNTCFIPIEVITLTGANVTWTNDDSDSHTVTSGDVIVGPDGMFDGGMLLPEQSFSYIFEHAGIFPYYCTIHPWKEGVIKVSNQEPENMAFSKLPEKSFTSTTDVEKIKQENSELKKQIKELQNEIENLRMLVLEQLKVINQWINSR